MVWADLILGRILRLVEDRYETGRDLDAGRAFGEGGVIHVAEAVGQSAAAHGITLPLTDPHLLAVTRRDGRPGDLADPARGTLLVLADGRLGVMAARGSVVESSGSNLSYVTRPEPGRYVDAWLIPGVKFLEVS